MLVKSRGREELIEEFHAQMEELQDECDSQEEPEEESKATDQVCVSQDTSIVGSGFLSSSSMCLEKICTHSKQALREHIAIRLSHTQSASCKTIYYTSTPALQPQNNRFTEGKIWYFPGYPKYIINHGHGQCFNSSSSVVNFIFSSWASQSLRLLTHQYISQP